MASISRRQALSAGAALGLGVAGAGRLLTTGTASAAPDSSAAQGGGRQVAEETRSLDELYQAAKAEGGKLVVYAGGDVASQQAGVVAAFKEQFPDIDLTMVVDYSKFHDARIDNQFAT